MTSKDRLVAALRLLPRMGPLDILSRRDIEQHFVYAPHAVFNYNGNQYVVKTRRSKAILFEDELGTNWRPRIAAQVIEEILRDQLFFQRHLPGSRYFVHAVFFPPVFVVSHDNRKFYKAHWRAARVQIA